MGWWMGVGYWENLEEEEGEEEEIEGKKKSRGSIDSLPFLILFLFLPFSFDGLPIFFPLEEEDHHSSFSQSITFRVSTYLFLSFPSPRDLMDLNSRNQPKYLSSFAAGSKREREESEES